MSALDTLRTSLTVVNSRFTADRFGDPKPLEKTVVELQKIFGDGRAPDAELVQRTLRSFLRTGKLVGYRDIKCACYGFMTPVQSARTVASSLSSTSALLDLVDQYLFDAKRMNRCFQALLSGYLSLDGFDPSSSFHEQWQRLRQRLASWLPTMKAVSQRPEWLQAVLAHENILSVDPTGRYGQSALQGDMSEFDGLCGRLSVDRKSWLRRRVVISAIDVATKEGDASFRAHLDPLIGLLRTHEGVLEEGVIKLLSRYAQQASTPEHMALRSIALDAFKNPLINANRHLWDRVPPVPRQMVESWLKGFLIERFFELLSHDGGTDKRRPKFWLRHRGSIENMWFILGASARSNWNADFKKLKETMGNQCLSLEGSTAGNNAFVMKIGKVYVVEFGERGNATYLFDTAKLPFDLADSSYIHLSRLKSDNHIERLLHMDGRDTWEEKFSDALARYDVYPDDARPQRPRQPPPQHRQVPPVPPRPPPQAAHSTPTSRNSLNDVFTAAEVRDGLKRFCNERAIRYDDRAPTGRLVVYADDKNPVVSRTLGQWGFEYDRDFPRWIWTP